MESKVVDTAHWAAFCIMDIDLATGEAPSAAAAGEAA